MMTAQHIKAFLDVFSPVINSLQVYRGSWTVGETERQSHNKKENRTKPEPSHHNVKDSRQGPADVVEGHSDVFQTKVV